MLKQSINIKLGTQLKLTPQLKHSLRILQLSVMDLQGELQQQLESNVMLERVNADESDALISENTDAPATENETELASEDHWDDVPTSELDTNYTKSSGKSSDLPEMRDFADHRQETLNQHLASQIDLERLPEHERICLEYLIDALDSDGFLIEPLNELHEQLQSLIGTFPKKDLNHALSVLQDCDPAGIAARDLSESLQIQLRRLDLDKEYRGICHGITQHLDLLAKNNTRALRRLCRTSEQKLNKAVEIVRNLNPRPGARFAQTENIHVVPDVVVKRHLGQWVIEVNQSWLPNIRVNKHYAKCIRGRGNDDLKQQLQEARWLLQGLAMRGETLIKVSQAIVSRQSEFLEHGEIAMQPMMMRELAKLLSVHESTISRVVANKYMQTPRGTYPLRFFFSSQITNDAGEAHSATAIKGMIEKLINAENPGKPLSDNKLTQLLKEDGIQVARRTVAKYREALGLGSSSERRSSK
ncbi:MAG: RNA polymerase factor sigma-54 [Gammaproteobacteria bacterium]|nr:RNA polymerase factor sigma-54 [Gammaproteobacteria bacterium]